MATDPQEIFILIEKGQDEQALALLESNPELINLRWRDTGNTLLHAVAYYGRTALVGRLASLLDVTNMLNVTPLHLAVLSPDTSSRLEMVQLLAQLGTQAGAIEDTFQCTPFHSFIRGLVDAGITSLPTAEDVALLKLLVSLNPSVINKATFLQIAACGSGAVLELLYHHGCKPYLDSQDEEGDTPLHLAVGNIGDNKGYPIETLLRLGSQAMEIKNVAGMNPYQLACLYKNGSQDILEAVSGYPDPELKEEFVLGVRHRIYFCRSLLGILIENL